MITLSPLTYSLAYGDAFDIDSDSARDTVDPADLPAKRKQHAGEKPISSRQISERAKASGLLQHPFGYFNPGLGVMYNFSVNGYQLATPHPVYEATKAGYDPTAITADKPNFSGAYQYWSVFLDLGQFRLGHDFQGSDQTTLLSETYMESSYSPTNTIRELKIDITRQNYAWLGASLLSFGEKDGPLFFTLWLDYAFDRYNFSFKDYKYYHSMVYPPTSELAAENPVGSGGGWGHNISLNAILTSSQGRAGRGELAWSLSLKTGYNFGELSDSSNGWHSRFSGWTAGLALGLQFNYPAAQEKTEECYIDPGMSSGQFCDLK